MITIEANGQTIVGPRPDFFIAPSGKIKNAIVAIGNTVPVERELSRNSCKSVRNIDVGIANYRIMTSFWICQFCAN